MTSEFRRLLRIIASTRYQWCVLAPSAGAALIAIAFWPLAMPAWLACYIAMLALAEWSWRMRTDWRALRGRGTMVARRWAGSPGFDYEHRFAIITMDRRLFPRRLWIMVHSRDGQVQMCQGFTLTRRKGLTPQQVQALRAWRRRAALLERPARDELAFSHYAHPHAAAGSSAGRAGT